MAGPLTWRNVQAPDFSGAMEGYKNFSNLLDRSLSGLQTGVAKFDRAQDDAANSRIMNELMAIQDPKALQAALESGQFNSPRMNDQTRSALMSRPGQLLEQATGFRNFDQAEAREAAAPDAMKIIAQASSGKPEDMAAANAAFSSNPLFAEMGFKSMTDLFSTYTNAAQTGLGMDRTRNDMRLANAREGRDATEFGWSAEDRELDQQAESIMGNLWGYDDQADAQAALAELAGSNPRLYGRVAQRMGWGGPKDYDSAFPGGDGILGSTGGYDDFVVALESEGKAGAKNPMSSATGLHQFLGDTWLTTVSQAKPAWAQGMSRDQLLAARRDPAKSTEMERHLRGQNTTQLQSAGAQVTNENLYAMHHFGPGGGVKFARASDDTPMKAILSPKQIAANPYLKNMSKGDLIQNWRTRASRVLGRNIDSVAQTSDRSVARTAAAQEVRNQAPLAEIFTKYAESGNNNPRQVAAALAKSNPGINADALEAAIVRETASLGNSSDGTRRSLNAETIGNLIVHRHGSRTANRPWYSKAFRDPLFGDKDDLGGGLVYDSKAVGRDLKSYLSGGLDQAKALNAGQAEASANEKKLQTQITNLEARIEAKRKAAAAGKKVNVGKELMQLQSLRAQLEGVYDYVDGPNGLTAQPEGGAPPPEQAAPSTRQASNPTPVSASNRRARGESPERRAARVEAARLANSARPEKRLPPPKPLDMNVWGRAIQTLPQPVDDEIPFYLRRR